MMQWRDWKYFEEGSLDSEIYGRNGTWRTRGRSVEVEWIQTDTRCSDIMIPNFAGEEDWDDGNRMHTSQMIDDPLEDEEVDAEYCTLHIHRMDDMDRKWSRSDGMG